MNFFRVGLCAWCLGSVTILAPAVATAVDLDPGVNLFFVKRSKNSNEVHYDAVVDRESCVWKEPYVDYYWRDLAEGDLVYNRIMPWEPPAYGFNVVSINDAGTEIEISLRPFESADIDRPITARLTKTDTGCSISTTIKICDTEAKLLTEVKFQSAYIKVAGFLDWSYAYFDILGYKTGSNVESVPVAERFKKDENLQCKDKVHPMPPPMRWQSGVVEKGLQMGRQPASVGAKSDTVDRKN